MRVKSYKRDSIRALWTTVVETAPENFKVETSTMLDDQDRGRITVTLSEDHKGRGYALDLTETEARRLANNIHSALYKLEETRRDQKGEF
jgi:hypothetical protein